MAFSIFPLPHSLSSGLMRMATSIKFLSKKGTRASIPQADIDLLARKQSNLCNLSSLRFSSS